MRKIPTDWGTFLDFPDTAVGRTLAEGRFWDAHLKPFMDEAAGDGQGAAIDVGAYIGFFTCYLATRYRHVLAIEPQPDTYQLLAENTKGCARRVTLMRLAAYDRVVTFSPADGAEIGWDPGDPNNAPGVPLIVPTGGDTSIWGGPLDPFLAPSVDVRFVKIDAQGCDLRVLHGLARTIARCRPLIVFEWEAHYASFHGDDWSGVERWAEQTRYQVTRITPDMSDYVARPQ